MQHVPNWLHAHDCVCFATCTQVLQVHNVIEIMKVWSYYNANNDCATSTYSLLATRLYLFHFLHVIVVVIFFFLFLLACLFSSISLPLSMFSRFFFLLFYWVKTFEKLRIWRQVFSLCHTNLIILLRWLCISRLLLLCLGCVWGESLCFLSLPLFFLFFCLRYSASPSWFIHSNLEKKQSCFTINSPVRLRTSASGVRLCSTSTRRWLAFLYMSPLS